MTLDFNINLAENYKSKSQIARVLTEDWVTRNVYCPNCGKENLNNYPNNKPVADFYCPHCYSDFELKSQAGSLGKKILDGSYQKMINQISSNNNPHFFFLHYSKNYSAENFLVIPSHFFSLEIIEKKRPLSKNARRSGWVGCNILLGNLPEAGRIYLLKDGHVIPKEKVSNQWKKTAFLRDEIGNQKGWLIEIIGCIDKLSQKNFTLSDMYRFESHLRGKYPENRFIREKIRQQLQVLRDKEYIEFLGKGKYRKL